VVSDFLSVDTVFLRRLYVLLYMELATRRVVRFAVTANPDSAWVTQQSRNLVWQLEGSSIRFLIHDHDAKFAGPSDAVFQADGIRVIRTPIAAPRANACMERQISSGRRECLEWMLITGCRHLERVMGEWIEHYNAARPHRSLDRERQSPGRIRSGQQPWCGVGRVLEACCAGIRACRPRRQNDCRLDGYVCLTGWAIWFKTARS
jgi:transposase InsO family protein